MLDLGKMWGRFGVEFGTISGCPRPELGSVLGRFASFLHRTLPREPMAARRKYCPPHHLPHLHTLIPVLPVTPKWRKICRWGLRATPGIWPMSCGSGPSRSHVNPAEPASRTESQSFRCSRNCGKTVHMTPQDVQGAPKRSQGPRDASRRLHEAPRRFLDASRDPPGLPGRNRDFPWEHTHF